MLLKNISVSLIIISVIILISGFSLDKSIAIKNSNKEAKEISKKITANDYYAILEIPKINLKKELFPINSKENNVNKNILVHNISTFPDARYSNIILAAHSGTGKNAYFKDLYQLKEKDEIKLYYNNHLYTYKIDEITFEPKTGELNIKRKKDYLLLITCTKNNSKTQTIYYAKRVF